MAKQKAKKHVATEETDPLELWLDRVNARMLWSAELETGAFISCYAINGQTAIVTRFSNKDGWDLYVPACKENDTAMTLDAAALVLGVEGCAGLFEVVAK